MLKTRTVLVNGPVDQKLAEKVMGQLLILDADNRILLTRRALVGLLVGQGRLDRKSGSAGMPRP